MQLITLSKMTTRHRDHRQKNNNNSEPSTSQSVGLHGDKILNSNQSTLRRTSRIVDRELLQSESCDHDRNTMDGHSKERHSIHDSLPSSVDDQYHYSNSREGTSKGKEKDNRSYRESKGRDRDSDSNDGRHRSTNHNTDRYNHNNTRSEKDNRQHRSNPNRDRYHDSNHNRDRYDHKERSHSKKDNRPHRSDHNRDHHHNYHHSRTKNKNRSTATRPSFLTSTAKIPRTIQATNLHNTVPNYRQFPKQDQDYYYQVLVSNFKDMKKTHNIEQDLEQLPQDVTELHLLYNSYHREIEISNEVQSNIAKITATVVIVAAASKLLKVDLSQVEQMTKAHMPDIRRYLYQMAIDNYNNRQIAKPNPMRDLLKIGGTIVGVVLASKAIEMFAGEGYSSLFSTLADVFVSTPAVTATVPKTTVPVNIASVPQVADTRQQGMAKGAATLMNFAAKFTQQL